MRSLRSILQSKHDSASVKVENGVGFVQLEDGSWEKVDANSPIDVVFTLRRKEGTIGFDDKDYCLVRVSETDRSLRDAQFAEIPLYTVFIKEWSREHGGINSFNIDFCRAMALHLWNNGQIGQVQVVSYDLESIPRQAETEEWGIRFSPIPRPKAGESSNFGSDVARKLPNIQRTDYIVGHDVVTGEVALEVATEWKATCILFNHHDYASYQIVKEFDDMDVEKKTARQTELRLQADLNVCVGPLLAQKVADTLRTDGRDDVPMVFIPGLWREAVGKTYLAPKGGFNILYVGRSDATVDRVKLAPVVVQAFATFCQRNRSTLGDAGLRIVGIDSESDRARLREIVEKNINWPANALFVDYKKDREDLLSVYGGATALFMPSVHEGYGLVALEAISRGLPVFISMSSGIYRQISAEGVLDKDQLEAIGMELLGSWGDHANESDLNVVLQKMSNLYQHKDYYVEVARKLREHLDSQWTWTVACANFHEEVSRKAGKALRSVSI